MFFKLCSLAPFIIILSFIFSPSLLNIESLKYAHSKIGSIISQKTMVCIVFFKINMNNLEQKLSY